MDRLGKMFDEQRQLQLSMPPLGREPGMITDPEERVQFIKDMTLALEDELHEFLGEVGWKPWATSRHINEEAAKGELVDAFHFFMNLCMVVHMTPTELFDKYIEKRQRNAQRQLDGYDGVQGKCIRCKRAFDDIAVAKGIDPLGMLKFATPLGVICSECVTAEDIKIKCSRCHRTIDELTRSMGLPRNRVFASVPDDELQVCLECAGYPVITDD